LDFLKENWKIVKEEVGDVILSLIDKNGLIRQDSSLWERHLSGAKQYLYTSIACAKGLQELCYLSRLMGEEEGRYRVGLERLKEGIKTSVDSNKVLKGSPREKRYYEATVVEAINFDLVSREIAEATLNAIEEKLSINGLGYKRNDDGSWYDEQEWVFIDLRVASAYLKIGKGIRAKEMVDWVLRQSQANFNLVAGLYEKDSKDYAGQVPMCGYGAGVYISILTQISQERI
jgi:GH15 family glucan-1,4-alpha-glucosidase